MLDDSNRTNCQCFIVDREAWCCGVVKFKAKVNESDFFFSLCFFLLSFPGEVNRYHVKHSTGTEVETKWQLFLFSCERSGEGIERFTC